MAANNYDTKRIFDSYVQRYLNEQSPTGETPEQVRQRQTASRVAGRDKTGAPTGQSAQTPDASTGTSGGTINNIPGVPPIPASGMTAKVTNPFDALMGGETNTYNVNAQKTMAARQAAGLPAVAGQTPAAGATTAEVTTPQPTAAPIPQATAAPQTATKTGEPSAEEKELFKKLHGSDYAPGVGDQRLAELRNAVQQVGNSSDVSKIANVAYAQQYQKSNPALAAGYAKRAQQSGINMMPLKPGQMQPSPAAAPQGDQVAQTGQGSAPQAKANTDSPEYKKWYEDGKSKGFI